MKILELQFLASWTLNQLYMCVILQCTGQGRFESHKD